MNLPKDTQIIKDTHRYTQGIRTEHALTQNESDKCHKSTMAGELPNAVSCCQN